jgi:hypothetical protein
MAEDQDIHRCDKYCLCSVHGTQLIYSPKGKDHACPEPDCKYANGMKDVLLEEYYSAWKKRWTYGRRGPDLKYQIVDEAAEYAKTGKLRRCVNDTDGDGDCAACARNPQALCRQTPEERWRRDLLLLTRPIAMEPMVTMVGPDMCEGHERSHQQGGGTLYHQVVDGKLACEPQSEPGAEPAPTPEERLLGALVQGMDSDCVDWLAAQKARQLIADYTRQLVRQQAEEWSDELKTRFPQEARAKDPWADGWLSAAEYIDEKG